RVTVGGRPTDAPAERRSSDLPKVPTPGTPGTSTFHPVVDHGAMSDTTASPRQRALRGAVLDIERHVSSLGWDTPVLVFSLVRTAAALAANPAIAAELRSEEHT